jgi:hypothetical protein
VVITQFVSVATELIRVPPVNLTIVRTGLILVKMASRAARHKVQPHLSGRRGSMTATWSAAQVRAQPKSVAVEDD